VVYRRDCWSIIIQIIFKVAFTSDKIDVASPCWKNVVEKLFRGYLLQSGKIIYIS